MPVFKIRHITQYRYDRPVRESANQIKIYPYSRPGQELSGHQLLITGEPNINKFSDFWGNQVGWFMVGQAHTQLSIDSTIVVKTSVSHENPLVVSRFADWADLKALVSKDLRLLDLTQPRAMTSADDLRSIVKELMHSEDSVAMFIQRCSEYIYENFTYKKGITTIETTLDEIMELRSGVCQDFALLLLQMIRVEGIPARYVSGYICPNRDGVRGVGATHAWVEVWLPGLGWAGIDPTNNTWVSDQHVVLAVGRHFDDCTPVKGTFKGPAEQELLVSVSVAFEDGTQLEDSTEVQMTREVVASKKKVVQQQQQQ